jgi:hypothetical protein
VNSSGRKVRLLEPSEEAEMLTFTGHTFYAVSDGGQGARLLRFVVQPGLGRYVILRCELAAEAAAAIQEAASDTEDRNGKR